MMTQSHREKQAAMLATIRQSLGRPNRSPQLRAEIRTRIGNPEPSIIPRRVQISHDDCVALFCDKAKAAVASLVTIASTDEIPSAVSDYLREQNLEASVTVAPHPGLENLPWDDQPLLEVEFGVPGRKVEVGLAVAIAGVAETGTLVLESGRQNPTTLNFLPEYHLVVLKKSQICGAYEEVWQQLRDQLGVEDGLRLPRTINMVTGPSRTGDIALTIELGAHGPRNLHIILIDDEAGRFE